VGLPVKPGISSRRPIGPRVRYSIHIPELVQDERRLKKKKIEKRLSGRLILENQRVE